MWLVKHTYIFRFIKTDRKKKTILVLAEIEERIGSEVNNTMRQRKKAHKVRDAPVYV